MKIKTLLYSLMALTVITISCNLFDSENSRLSADTDFSSYDKRSRLGALEQLFQQVLEKDEPLKELFEETEDLTKAGYTVKGPIDQYLYYSTEYYSAADAYANQITDSLLKKLITKKIKVQKEKYLLGKQNLDTKIDDHNKKINEANDAWVAIKVLTTLPKIDEFQDKKPDLEKLDQLIKDYEKLIDELKNKHDLQKTS
ncbi:MAG: hypothetical protein MRY83_19585 [Flavobacteriales bacterium]|nr:hypothetical protein [Flavobacteriales bacterium]